MMAIRMAAAARLMERLMERLKQKRGERRGERRWERRGERLRQKVRAGQRLAPAAGLSLLELMVVLVILGMVAAIAVPQVLSYLDRSKVDTAKIQVRSLSSILDLYRLDVGRYPTLNEGLEALAAQPSGVESWRGPYLEDATSLIDPWGNPYAYEVSDDGRTAAVLSLGADGASGGEGVDADIVK